MISQKQRTVHDAVNDALRQVSKISRPNTKVPKRVEKICQEKKQKN
jgi:hypothetical protein